MAYVDFDSLVISRRNIDCSELQKLLKHFSDHGVRKFIIAYDVDPEKEFITTVIHNLRIIKKQIQAIKPRGCKVCVTPSVLLRPNTAYEDYLRRLRLSGTNIVFLRLPPYWMLDEDNFFKSINHLLYKLKYLPVFTHYEDVFEGYPVKLAQKILKTRNAAFCFDIGYLSRPIGTVRIFSAIKAMNEGYGTLLIPSVCGDIRDHRHPERLFCSIKKHYGNDAYLNFCRFMNSSIRQVFPKK